jgi:coenzyme Q-binding protein COQ10
VDRRFSFSGNRAIMSQHAETRLLPFTPQQMYALVADIGAYPSFLPWCQAARVRALGDNELEAELVVGVKAARVAFPSRVRLTPFERIVSVGAGGALERLESVWIFTPEGAGCRVAYRVDFSVRSRVMGKVVEALFETAFRKTIEAFEARALSLYGAVK